MNNQSVRVTSARERLDREKLQVKDMMTQIVCTVSRDETLGDAEALMQRKGIRHIPVVDERFAIVGLISHRDLLRYSVSELSEVSQVDRNILYSEIAVGEFMHNDVFIFLVDFFSFLWQALVRLLISFYPLRLSILYQDRPTMF